MLENSMLIEGYWETEHTDWEARDRYLDEEIDRIYLDKVEEELLGE